MTNSSNRFVLSALLVLGTVAIALSGYTDDRGNDVCGDPLPSADMRQNPIKVVDWARQQPFFQEVNKDIDQHPFVRDLEAGKLSRDVMQRFVINAAYGQERLLRCLMGAINRHGQAWPVMEQRDVLEMVTMNQRRALEDLERLGAKFDIAGIEELLRHDPDNGALAVINAQCEAVMHADDVNEVVLPIIAALDHMRQIGQRLRDGLKNAAYKAWNLGDDDLQFFARLDDIDDAKLNRMLERVIGRGLDRRLTLCQVRRRTNAVQFGRRAFFDHVVGRNDRPSIEGHGF